MTLKSSSPAPMGRLLTVVAGVIILAGCGGSTSTPTPTPTPTPTNNVTTVDVNLGPDNNYVNGIFTTVEVCVPGSTTSCTSVPDVLVDTGSSGLRVLSSALGSLSLPANQLSGNDLQECIQFYDLSYDWGPVVGADIHIAGETASNAPIQIMPPSSPYSVPSSCLTLGSSGAFPNNSVQALGANGILGVSNYAQDCSGCTDAANGIPQYYICPDGDCQIASVPAASVLSNPVALFSQDNNGVLVSLPTVPAGGQATASGSLIFGIGTQSNNALGSAQIYATTADEYFTTTYNGTPYANSFIDSGSNALLFLDAATLGIPDCAAPETRFYCPASTPNFTVTNTGTDGTSGSVSFSIVNAVSLFNTGFAAFNNLGGDSGTSPSTDYFDFGIPFFFGRNVFVGIAGTTVPSGVSAPNGYWAY
jgi:hypothetical protein